MLGRVKIKKSDKAGGENGYEMVDCFCFVGCVLGWGKLAV